MASYNREPNARCYHATIASNRQVLVWGGKSSGEQIKTSAVECFDVVSTTWQETRQLSLHLPDGLHHMAVAWNEEKAYSFGGVSKSGQTNDIYEVDKTSLVCKKIIPSAGSAPFPQSRSAIICSGRRLINYGGFSDTGFSDEIHVFDLDTSEYC